MDICMNAGQRDGNRDYLHLVITRSHSLSIALVQWGAIAGPHADCLFLLLVSIAPQQTSVRSPASFARFHNREIRLLQSGSSCIPLSTSVWDAVRIPSNAPVIYVANRAWTNNTSLRSRFLSSCFWVAIIHRPRYIYRSRHFSHTKIPFEQRTSFFCYDKSSGGPFSGEYVAVRYCDSRNAFGALKTHVISENSENSFFIRNVYPGMTVEKLSSIRYQIKTNSFLARQRKAGAVLKRINWIAFVRENVDQEKRNTRWYESHVLVCWCLLIFLANYSQPFFFAFQ